MKTSSGESEDPESEVADLTRQLRAIEKRLEELTGEPASTRPASFRQEAKGEKDAIQSSILNALPAHIALIDRNGVILSVNDRWREFAEANGLHGRTPGVGENYLEICEGTSGDCGDEAQQVAAGIRSVLSGEAKGFSMEYPCHSPTEERWFVLMVNPMEREDGRGAVISHLDITARKIAEEALRNSEASLAIAQRIGHFGSWELSLRNPNNEQPNPLRWSDEMFRIVGLEPGSVEVSRELFFSMIPEDDAHQIRQAVAAAIQEGTPYSVVHRVVRPDGEERFVQETAEIFYDGKSGEPLKMIGAAHDVTDQRRAAQMLAAEEALLRLFIEHSPAAIAMLDTEMRYIQASARWIQDYHLTNTDIIGKSHYEIFPEISEHWKEIHRRVLAGAVERCEEDSFVRMDGSLEWLQWEARPWRKAGGTIGGVVFFTQVITARKHAEDALRRSEESFRKTAHHLAKVLDSSLDVICTFDAEGRFTQVSAASEKVWGYKPEELIGTNFINLVHPEDLPKTKAVDTRILAGEPTINFENRYIRKDGGVVHLRWSAWWSEADQTNFCVAHDKTSAHRTELAARELSERLELAAKASNVGIWDWNIETGTLHWDDQMYELYGSTRASGEEGLVLWERHLHPDDRTRAEAEFEEAMRPGGRNYNTLFRIIHPHDGVVRHIHAQGRVFRDKDGQPTRVLGTSRDATEQVLREESLRQKLENEGLLLQRALAGEKAKSEFLATMSHEIRTPMNGVLGFAEMLVQSPTLSQEDRGIAKTILSSGEALLRILDDVLDYSRIEAGRFTIEKYPCSPKDLMEGIDSLFRRQIERKGLEFIVSLNENVPDTVEADAGRIRQILVNLVGNAFKFTETGTIALTLDLSSDELGAALRFHVRDTGSGISPDRASAIFEAFTQEDSSISRRHGGTGLGLSISQRLAELMDGDLQMQSQEGEGTIFTLRVPVRIVDTQLPSDTPATGQLDEEFARKYHLRILVVDDDPVNLRLLLSVLKKLGFQPYSARNGHEAIDVYKKETPDCVLMDMQMPHMDGIQATQCIRVAELTRGIAPAFIVALTANIHQEDRDRCFAAGMNTYLNKPVRRQAIADMLVQAATFRAPVAPGAV